MTYGELPERLMSLDDATVMMTGGPARVVTDQPADPGWVPSPLLGFTVTPDAFHAVTVACRACAATAYDGPAPLLWDGDQA